ncbi:MAG: PRC-barrel domain-containing protein [Alphaproteobacteria bacterium]
MIRNRLGPVAVGIGALLAWTVAAGAAETTATGPQLAQAAGSAGGQGGSGVGTDRYPGGSAQMGAETGAAQQRFTRDLEGADVVDTSGKKIGTVSSVVGNRLIVSSGGLLGIGDRKVALGPAQVTLSGNGAERRIIATVSRDQLDKMPEYDASADVPGESPTTPTTPGGNRSGPSGTSGSPR